VQEPLILIIIGILPFVGNPNSLLTKFFLPILGILLLFKLFRLKGIKFIGENIFFTGFVLYALFTSFFSISPSLSLRQSSIYIIAVATFFAASEVKNWKWIKLSGYITGIGLIFHLIFFGGSHYSQSLGRASGTFFHPNASAGFLLAFLPLTMGYGIHLVGFDTSCHNTYWFKDCLPVINCFYPDKFTYKTGE